MILDKVRVGLCSRVRTLVSVGVKGVLQITHITDL